MKELIETVVGPSSALVLGAVLFAWGAAAAEPSHETLIAHRGESVDAPENTLPAYRTAVERGFGFECDIYLSRDKTLFTFHDRTLGRTTSGANTNACTAVDWAGTISELNVGGWGKWKGSAFDPTRPALFSEVLALARDGRYVYVEVKGDDPTWVPYVRAEMARAGNANPGNVLFISFGRRVCAELKRQLPDYKVFHLMSSRRREGKARIPWTAAEVVSALGQLKVDGVDIQFDPAVHDAAFVKAVKDAGYEFHVWTVDDLATAKKAFAVGADTLTTNCAKKILEESQAERARKPPSSSRQLPRAESH